MSQPSLPTIQSTSTTQGHWSFRRRVSAALGAAIVLISLGATAAFADGTIDPLELVACRTR